MTAIELIAAAYAATAGIAVLGVRARIRQQRRLADLAEFNASLDAASGRRGTAHGPVPHRRTVKPGSAEEHTLQTQTQPFKPRQWAGSPVASSTRRGVA